MRELSSEPFCFFSAFRFVFLLAALVLLTACEIDMTVAVDGQNPPTFKLSGSGNLDFFLVSEVSPYNLRRPPIDRDSDRDTVLWEIWPKDISYEDRRIWKLPSITYSNLPQGFIQKIPASGEPPPLVEGKMYSAGGPASNANGGFVLFTICGGKAVVVDKVW